MPQRRNSWGSRARAGALVAAAVLAVGGCGSDAPPPSQPARPPQPAAAKPATPAAAPAPPPAPPFVYEVKGRRDPFDPLIKPKPPVVARPGVAKKPSDVPDVNQLKLSGIVWEQRGFFALVEAPNGRGYVLRVNDRVGEDARVTRITPDTVIFEVKDESPLPQAKVPVRVVELKLRKEE